MMKQEFTTGYMTYKGRKLDPSKKVRLYRNLHNGKISIKQGSHVIGHTESACIRDARFLVSEKGRQKVLADKQKNVHAYIEGYWSDSLHETEHGEKVWYNPYKTAHFRTRETNEACLTASCVVVDSTGDIEIWT